MFVNFSIHVCVSFIHVCFLFVHGFIHVLFISFVCSNVCLSIHDCFSHVCFFVLILPAIPFTVNLSFSSIEYILAFKFEAAQMKSMCWFESSSVCVCVCVCVCVIVYLFLFLCFFMFVFVCLFVCLLVCFFTFFKNQWFYFR